MQPAQPCFLVPLRSVYSSQTGVTGFQANLPLLVQTMRGVEPVTFRVDTGASVTSMPLRYAQALNINVPNQEVAIPTVTAVGQITRIVRNGRIWVWLPQWRREQPFDWPCYFDNNQPQNVPPLLGLAGVINDLRLTLDGAPSPGAAFGNLVVEVL